MYNVVRWQGSKGLIFRASDTVGTLSKDNDNGSETVGKKMNLRSFILNHVYLDPLNMPNTGDFSWSWILKGFSSSYVNVLYKTSN